MSIYDIEGGNIDFNEIDLDRFRLEQKHKNRCSIC